VREVRIRLADATQRRGWGEMSGSAERRLGKRRPWRDRALMEKVAWDFCGVLGRTASHCNVPPYAERVLTALRTAPCNTPDTRA